MPAGTGPQPEQSLALAVPAGAASSLAGFRAWATSDDFPENLRAAYLDGELFLDLSNEEPEFHVSVKTEIIRVLGGLVKELKLGKFYAGGLLVSNEDANVSSNPDASFVSRASFRARRVKLVVRDEERGLYCDAEGTPDWVLEVVSDSSVRKDTQRLREGYHRAGVPEYWLIDARGDEIDFQVLHRRKTGYAAAPRQDGWQ